MLDLGITPVGNSPEELAAIVRADLDKWTRVAKQAGVKAE
jgi:tripartite-type tricarboxylate transporter receptor subunit TctC